MSIWVASPTKDNIYETKANIGYSAQLNVSGASISAVQIVIGNQSNYIITNNFNISGKILVSGLTAGAQNSVKGQITYWYSYIPDGGTTSISTSTTYYSDSLNNIFTHPGVWHWSDYIRPNDIIQQKLTASRVNQWVDHLAAWKSWDTQSYKYDLYNSIYNPITKSGFKVESGEPIYLEWFNNCANAHPNRPTISHNNNEDIISVSRFSTLDFNGTDQP